MKLSIQKWQKRHPFRKILELGIKKIVVVISKNFVSQIAIEQAHNKNEQVNMHTRYFDNIPEAKERLLLKKELT